MTGEQKILEARERGDLVAELSAMIEDLEAEPAAAEISWLIDGMRSARAEAEGFDWLAQWLPERVPGWALRHVHLVARGEALRARGGRAPRADESARDLDREAQRLRRGEAAPNVPEATREREAALLEEAARLLRDKQALNEELMAAVAVIDARITVSLENHAARETVIRTVARLLEDAETLQRLNQQRRRTSGRRRKKKKK